MSSARDVDILLVGVNASWVHTSFALRYLRANLGRLHARSAIFETTTKRRPLTIAEQIIARRPAVVGFSTYIWNVTHVHAIAQLLQRMAPEISIVLGGPEVSHEWNTQAVTTAADHVIVGEADVAFRALCESLLDGRVAPRVIHAPLPDLASLVLPYDEYDETDVRSRVIYVEASRGCPFQCQFCLSALDERVRAFPLQAFFDAMQGLLDRGARRFKFVDRTFNLSPRTSEQILLFFLERMEMGLFLHFEMIPDRFPDRLRALVERFPPGALQLEIGVQSLNDDVCRRIARRQDGAKALANLRWLVHSTNAHLHADLIVGLPGENLSSFADGFDALWASGVQEIQVGILKRLHGAPVTVHDDAHSMVYSPLPPYELLCNRDLDIRVMAQMRWFARAWDAVVNSGRFAATVAILLAKPSPFRAFKALSDETLATADSVGNASLDRWIEMLFAHLVTHRGEDAELVARSLLQDRRSVTGKAHVPKLLRPFADGAHTTEDVVSPERGATPARQRRHLATNRRN